MLVDGLTAANDLGLTTPMPFTGVIHTDARRRAIEVDGLTIDFKRTAPSKHYGPKQALLGGWPPIRIVRLPCERRRGRAVVSLPSLIRTGSRGLDHLQRQTITD
jgi:hypothetical protein